MFLKGEYLNNVKGITNRSYGLVTVIVLGLIFQSGMQESMRAYAIDGYLFQEWSSESLMQTVSIEDLRNTPFESLYNIHIQPPGLDMLRAILVQLWPSLEIHVALKKVDLSLYFLWTLLYSISGSIVFIWLTELADTKFAFVATLFFLLHPALIFYTTLLDTTLLTSVLILWLYYLLWRVRTKGISIVPLTGAMILLFFFRSIFQLPFILIIGLTLFLLRVPARKLALFLIVTITVCGLYIAKQKAQFGIASASSFTGINLVRSANITNYEYPYEINLETTTSATLPNVLTRTKKINGKINYNNFQYLYFNQRLIKEYKQYLSKLPLQELVNSYYENLELYFAPSSTYWTHVIVDRLPWRRAYDEFFSSPILPLLFLIATAISIMKALRDGSFFHWVAMLLPALYVFAVSVIFEKGENSRFKFFLEPVFYVFILSQLYSLHTWIYSGQKNKKLSPPAAENEGG